MDDINSLVVYECVTAWHDTLIKPTDRSLVLGCFLDEKSTPADIHQWETIIKETHRRVYNVRRDCK